MIRIAVSSRQGLPPPTPLLADFGPQGGTIGRADTNTLVLDDPDRTVSRVHAQVLCREGRYFIVDRGSNPLHCNGMPLGAGNEVPLQGGERLVIGGFELVVTAQAGAAPLAAAAFPPPAPPITQGVQGARLGADDDPFADLLAGLGGPPSAPAPSAAPVPMQGGAMPFPDPMAQAAPGIPDPFADLLGPGPGGGHAGNAAPAMPADDFSDLGLPAAASPTASAQRIDELFGGVGDGLGGDPLAMSPLADPLLQPNTASAGDPLAAFGQVPSAAQQARADHLPIGQFGFTPPRAEAAPAPAPVSMPAPAPVQGFTQAPAPAAVVPRAGMNDEVLGFDDQTGQPIRISRAPAPPPVVAVAPAPTAMPAMPAMPASVLPDEFFSEPLGTPPAASGGMAPAAFDDLLGGLAPPPAVPVMTPPAPPPHVPAAPMVPMAAPAPITQPLAQSVAQPVAPPMQPPAVAAFAPPPAPVPQATPVAPVAAASADTELLAAFLRGLGSVHQAPTTLTPALMERLGSLLRSSTEGTLQLLLTRQELKREVRAEVTMIAAQANNPLKFSPTVDVALTHLLGPGMRGFMPAEAAMRDAYDDLRAHQFGVMVGMRAALERLIARFAPGELEKKIAARSALDSFFAANRKAKLWDQFTALYGTIAAEAEDDFHALFGKAFLEAYEAQMARLKSAAPPAS